MKIALDPTPFHHSHSLLEFPALAADLGYRYLQMTPHADMIPFFRHPKADDALVAQFRKNCEAAGVEVASVLPVLRWSGPDETLRQAAVRYLEAWQQLGETLPWTPDQLARDIALSKVATVVLMLQEHLEQQRHSGQSRIPDDLVARLVARTPAWLRTLSL